MKINWNSIGALITSVVGIVSHPEVAALLPEKVALVLSGIGIIWQAMARPVHHTSPTQ